MKTFNEMRKIDVSNYINKRDGADYINWAVVKQLLHDNGCEKVYYTNTTSKWFISNYD